MSRTPIREGNWLIKDNVWEEQMEGLGPTYEIKYLNAKVGYISIQGIMVGVSGMPEVNDEGSSSL